MTLKTKKCKKDATLFKRYEKDRRSRFNALLDKLASLLPNFQEANDSDQKWTKAQIVEFAIKHIRSFQQLAKNDDIENAHPNASRNLDQSFKILKRQYKKLREILRNEFVPEMPEKEFCCLDLIQLQELIDNRRNDAKQRSSQDITTVTDAINDAGDVFVVSTESIQTACDNTDHNYSITVQQEAEVEIGSDIEPEETDQEIVILGNNEQVLETNSFVEVINESTILDAPLIQNNEKIASMVSELQPQQPIIIQMAPPTNYIQPLPTVIQSAPIRSIGSPMTILPPPNKLPLPRTYNPATCSTGLVNIYNTPVVASQPWRLPKEKRRRRKEGKKTPKPAISDNTENQIRKEAENVPQASEEATEVTEAKSNEIDSNVCVTAAATQPSINSTTVLDSDFVRVSASESVPQTILASQDNGENEQEIVDLTVETVNAVSTISDDANVTVTATPDRVLKTPKSKQEKVAAVQPLSEDQKKSAKKPTKLEENEKGPVVGGRRAKSSYSIAALCQMSVNIGGDPAAGVPDSLQAGATGVNSPGVVSLNSATESPRATPTPQSPMPMPKQQQMIQPPISTSASQNSHQQQLQPANFISNSSVRKVIQELKPVGNDTIIAGSSITNSCQNQKQTKSALPRDEVQQPTSPTKSYLTQFPVVKGQQKKLDPKLGQNHHHQITTTTTSSTANEVGKVQNSPHTHLSTSKATTTPVEVNNEVVNTRSAGNVESKTVLKEANKASSSHAAVAAGTGTQSVVAASLSGGVSVASSAPTMQVSGPALKMNTTNHQPINQSYNNPVNVQSRHTSNNSIPDYGYQATGPACYSNSNATDFMGIPSRSGGPPHGQAYPSNKSGQAQMHAYNAGKHNRNSSMPQPPSHMPSSMTSAMNQNMFSMQTDPIHQHMHPGYQAMSDQAPLAPPGVDTFFSVSQMVNHKSSGPQFSMASSSSKKASKRSAPSTSLSSNLSSSSGSRYQKQPRSDNKIESLPSGSSKKDTDRKNSKSQSRSSSSSRQPQTSRSSSNSKRGSYTTESLLSHGVSGVLPDLTSASVSGSNLNHQSQSGGHGHHHYHHHHRNVAERSNKMPELNWNPVGVAADSSSSHFASFPSISPSPNLFSSQDFGFDFSTSMFGDMHGATPVSSSSQLPVVSSHSSSSSTASKHQRKDQRSIGYELNMGQPHQQPLQHNHPQPQEFHDQHSAQQQHIFDANFFTGATVPGTLTPPSVSSIYPTQDEGYINFAASAASMNAVTTTSVTTRGGYSSVKSRQPQMQPQPQQMTDHHHTQRQMLPDQQHIQGYSSQQQQHLSNNTAQPGGSSYINFNLETIFPGIAGAAAPVPPVPVTDKIAALLPTVPSTHAPSSARASTSISLPAPPTIPPLPPPGSGVPSTDFRSIASTPDILPPSIAIFQHPAPHQMNFTSFSASTFSSSASASATTSNSFSLNE